MKSDNRQITHLKERLSVLLSTHLTNLPHQFLKAASGDVLMKQDEPAKRVLLIKSGELRIERIEDVGTAKVIAVVGANELVGEMGLIGEPYHSATVTVHQGPAEFIAIQSDDLLQAALYDSDLVMELLALCSSRCRQTNRHLALLLEALHAMRNRDHEALEQCCNRLDSQVESGLGHTAELLRDLETLQGPR
jgi:CRP-like cAMP-binding protein